MYIDENIKNILCKVRDNAIEKGITASISCHHENSHLMRIGNNSVSLSTSEELTRLDIEVTNGRKQGTHTQMGDIVSVEEIEKALKIAVDKAEIAKEKDYQPLLSVIEKEFDQKEQYDVELEQLDPAFKAEGYKAIFDSVGNQYNYSGSWSSGSSENYLVMTSNKKELSNSVTDQLFNIVLKHPENKWELSESQSGWKKSDFSAKDTIEKFKNLVAVYENNAGYHVDPGEYTVMFGPLAIAELIQSATWTGFSGRSYEEKQGWTSKNKIGDTVLGKNITIIDDPEDENTFQSAFDYSGKTRKLFPIVENGVLAGLMYDSTAAAKFKKDKTGHDVGATGIVLKTGEGSADYLEAIKEYDKVLFIPALHYINLPNTSKGIFTGSSRFNALLIEKGKVISPILSSRVTDSFQSVFGNVKIISEKAVSVNLSDTYGRRSPVAMSVPSYIVSEGVKITDCAVSF